MKQLKYTLVLLLCAIISSCSSDNDATTENLTGQKGSIALKFDNGVGDQNFAFNTTYQKSNNESFQLTTDLKYIISNVRFKDQNGNEFAVPEGNNMFIIDQDDANNAGEIFLNLDNIDAANYTEITFGIGVDQDKYTQGATGQGNFLTLAQDKGMFWSWASGYKFVRLDGVYTDATTTNGALAVHMGSVGTSLDNYKEVTLTLPNTVLVRTNKSPEIHIKADILKIFDGETSVNFADGYNQVHTDATETPIIAVNMQNMFTVHHVHND